MRKLIILLSLILGIAAVAYALPQYIAEDWRGKYVQIPNGELVVPDLKVTDDVVVVGDLPVGGDLTVTASFATTGVGKYKFTGATLAAAGNSSATAALIASRIVYVTGADGTVGVRLPVGLTGSVYLIVNVTAADLILYPDTGGQINGGGADTPVTVASGERAIVFKAAALTWYGGVFVGF